nr:NBS-LRR disease resistance protein [Dasypyrum villosum]
MAEAVVGHLVVTLGSALATEAATFSWSLLCQEAAALRGLFGKIRESKAELESMQAYLQEAERFKDTDRTTAIFVSEVRGLAFQIEDVVDEFTYKLEDCKHGGFAGKVKKRLKHIRTWHRLAAKLQEIEANLQDAKRRKKDYPVVSRTASKLTSHALHFTRDEDLVGIEENKERLIQWLTDGGGGSGSGGDGLEQSSSKVTTVWGMPGVGKTTLVAHVYNTLKLDFDAVAWVTVSESYRLDDLLKKIAAELSIAVDVTNIEMRGLAESIHDYLQGKKFILVLDDVWTPLVWSEIRNVFPTSNCTSRFVITSRKHAVSLLATRESAIHLEPLQAHHSWVLFCKGAFWNNDDKECPLELQKLALKFIAKCQGLPIAIACIGRLLSCRPPTSAEWENVYMGLDSQLAKDVIPDAHMILKVSLEDLPYDLKNCFLHCSLFPEDYVLKRKTIVRQWIAAGFIRETEVNITLEEVAEGYLTELVNRSLLQVVERNYAGRLKYCRMHDVIRLLALNKAKEECFGKVYNGSGTGAFSVEGARRISVQGKTGRLQNLEVLDAVHSKLTYLPSSVVKLQNLRYLYASSTSSTSENVGAGGVKVPNGIQQLTGLRALQRVNTTPEFLHEVGALTELRTFDVCNVRSEYSADLSNAITKMSHLVHLVIVASAENEVLRLEGLYLPPTLSWLALRGQLEKISMPQLFSSWSHLDSLTQLQLAFSNIDEETFSCLGMLRGLRSLGLMRAFEGKRLHFDAGSFPKLRFLHIWGAAQLNQVGIEEGAMQNLVELLFAECPELKFLPDGIEHLAALEKLIREDTSEELIEKRRQKRDSYECSEDVTKISHIRNITVRLTQKGLLERIR